MKRLLVLLSLLAGAPAVCAQERFHIARIEVRQLVHASADVIRSESRLREGQTYDENELREANDRIRRLPFVLDASFSLERGAAHGEHVLVIAVKETRPLFYRFELVPYLQSRDNLSFLGNDSLFGGRWFAGRRDVLHLAAFSHVTDRPFDSSYNSLQAGYTRYGLFDDRGFATVTLSMFAGMESSSHAGPIVPGALVGIYLKPQQTLTISYKGVDAGTRRRHSQRVLEARFAHNTTNHPFFPTSGSLVSIAPVAAWVDAIDEQRVAIHDFDAGVDARAARYWPLDERHALAGVMDGGMLYVSERKLGKDEGFFLQYGSASLTLTRALGDMSRESDRRAELTLRVTTRHREIVPLLPQANALASLSWVRRNEWGVLRFGLGYTW